MKISICAVRNTIRTITAIGLFLLACSTAQSQTNTSPWSFVSSPDWFNQDIADLSGSTDGVMEAPGWDNNVSGGTNGVSTEMVTVYDSIVTEMASYNPEAVAIAGDLINGVWFKDETLLDMFDPSTRNRATAISNAASIYYGWQKQLFASNGINIVLGAIGDHEIGDDDWPEGSEKASHVTTMKQAFSENMVDPLGLPDQINGVSSRPTVTGYQYGNYAYQLNNVLFVTVDVWRQDNPATVINEHYRSVSPEITNTAVLDWLDDILVAADNDATIDHVIVQGHTPVLRPVRMQLTSGTLLVNREDSGFWQILRQHDHTNGGKVRFYLSGEVHTITATKDLQSDIIQLVHGNPPIAYGPLVDIPGTTHGNYAAFTVHPDRIEVDMRRFELQSVSGGSSIYWQVNNPATPGPSSVSPSQSVGTLAIDTSGIDTTYQKSGLLEFVDYKSLVVNFDFDQTVASGNYSNSGSIGNLYYEGRKTGNVTASPGMFGNGILLDGSTGYIESGRGNITDGESRTVTGWIKTGSGGARPILSYGTNKTGINGRFEFRLMNGRPELRIASSIICKPGSTPLINDNSWHHVAIVLPNDHSNTCADVLFYIDGQQYPSGTNYASASINTVAWGFYRIGRNEFGSSEYFNGSIDDISVWGAPLTSAEVRALANAGTHPYLQYDALDMKMLLDQFNSGQGITNVGTNEWQSVTGLTGNGGDILTLNGNIAIQLDDLGNGIVSDIAVPVGPALLEDDFSDGNTAGWTMVDNCPYSTPEWSVQTNVLMQTNNCFGFSQYGIPLGTYQLSATTLTGDIDIQVQLRAEDPSTDPVTSNNSSNLKFGTIGMLFGYQDANNYYRLDLNARNGYRKLWRVQGGTFTELVTSPQGYVGDQWMDLRIIHQNGVILIFIDGIQVMAAADATYSSGKIAFFCAVNPNCSFDNLVVTTAPDDPMPGINLMDSSSPAHASGEYFVTPGNTLDVVGMTTVTTGIGGIEFVLDEGTGSQRVQTDLTSPYSSQFDSLAPGEHTLTAYLLDTSAARLTAGTASVTMPRIGTGGIHLHAIGDSITFGLLDDIAADDISSDSRNIGGGYTPVLNNYLSAYNGGSPVTVTNDGISGERTSEGAYRIGTVLARTPAAQAYLIGYGTNDSGSMPLIVDSDWTLTIKTIPAPISTTCNRSSMQWYQHRRRVPASRYFLPRSPRTSTMPFRTAGLRNSTR